jgi:sulfate adenylyltransferase
LISPHGGSLVNGQIVEEQAEALKEDARSLPNLVINTRQLSDAHMIAQGAFSPLTGFMGHEDYNSVVKNMHLDNGQLWPLPVTLAVDSHQAANLKEGKQIALSQADGEIVGILSLSGKFRREKVEEAQAVYMTTDVQHPGVANLYQDGDVVLSGKVTLFQERLAVEDGIEPHYMTPAQTRESISNLGWNTVVGFQTTNPVFRSDEYIQKCALEVVDGLMFHPMVGETKVDDIAVSVRMRSYQTLLKNYYAPGRVLFSVLPSFMRYAGPREAIFHAIVRKNYGCTHFIVSRDYAGVGNYYGAYDAQHIFKEFEPIVLGIIPMFFDNSFFCKRCKGMASEKTCPHGTNNRISLSDTQMMAMLSKGEMPPVELTRPEVAKVLIESKASR